MTQHVRDGLPPRTMMTTSAGCKPVPRRATERTRTLGTDVTQTRPGYFGRYGGRYVAATLLNALEELEAAFNAAMDDPGFHEEYHTILRDYAGRPSPLYPAQRLSEHVGAKVYLKREDLNHTGAHKINNTIGQGLLARRMGKQQIIAETGAGQHGVATATVAALLGLPCKVFMGVEDVRRQKLNVYRMRLLGAEVVPVEGLQGTLKDACDEAMRYWMGTYEDTLYIFGSVAGPHPYPTMVREFQRVIGCGDSTAADDGHLDGMRHRMDHVERHRFHGRAGQTT